jgi:hypothetical protein
MAKPVTLPLWATDTTNTTIGAVENGQTVKLEPSTGVKQQGWIAGEEAPARWMNWLLNNIYTWAVYLDGLATDAQFLANDFNFTGDNSFTGTSLFLGYTEVPGMVSNGNVAINGTLFINTGTLQLNAGDGVFGSAKTRTKMAPLQQSLYWNRDENGEAGCIINGGGTGIELPMPGGATLTDVKVSCFQGTTAATPMNAQVFLHAPNGSSPNTRTAQGSVAACATGAGNYELDPSFTPFVVADGNRAFVRIYAADTASTQPSIVLRVSYTYTETRATGT